MNSEQSRSRPPVFGHIDLTKSPYQPGHAQPGHTGRTPEGELNLLLRQLLIGQKRQNDLLEELLGQIGAHQRQKANELGNWKQANPQLARRCRKAAEALGKVHMEFVDGLTREIAENYENLMEGDFMLTEFIDRFGPRMAHLNGLLQLLSQLSSTPNPAGQTNVP